MPWCMVIHTEITIIKELKHHSVLKHNVTNVTCTALLLATGIQLRLQITFVSYSETVLALILTEIY